MRDKVIRAIEIYAEGGTMDAARKAVSINGLNFYRVLRENLEIKELYYEVQKARADMMYDEAYQISTDGSLIPHAARVMAEIRMKIGQAYDRKRFGDKVAVEIDAGPNLQLALEAAKSRALLPTRDLVPITDAQYVEIAPQSSDEASDEQSAAAPYELPPGVPDPFDD